MIWYFFIYAFLGWCTEVVYKAATAGKFVNRGFLNGPVCPIYGFGVVLVIGALSPLSEHPLLVFAGGFVITTSLEWLTGFALEKLFHAKWWDYSGEPFQLGGYVCLKFSLLWGLACLLVMDVLHPMVEAFVALIPVFIGRIFLVLFLFLLSVDTILTVNTVLKLNKQLRRLSEIGAAMRNISEEIGESLFESVADLSERNERVSAALAEHFQEAEETRERIKAHLTEKAERYGEELSESILEKFSAFEEMKAKYENLAKEHHFGYARIEKAFPKLRHVRYEAGFESVRKRLKEKAKNASSLRQNQRKKKG